jgi:hypothetical protein
MLEPSNLLKLVHALVGVLLVAGLVGRWITLGYASRMTDVVALRQVLAVSARFERIVIGTSIAVLILGVVTAWAQGRAFLGPIQGAPIDWLFVSLLLYLSVLPLVPLVFLPKGRVFDAALDEATAKGAMTDRLRVAFHDRVVFAAHAYELGAIVVVLALMIAKPF